MFEGRSWTQIRERIVGYQDKLPWVSISKNSGIASLLHKWPLKLKNLEKIWKFKKKIGNLRKFGN